jgi:ABC-type dipeptide/oligopeptide/nickel transport system permease subunit
LDAITQKPDVTPDATFVVSSISSTRYFWKMLLSRKIVLLAIIILILLVLIAIFAPFVAPYDPYQQNLRAALQKPSAQYLLGTDLYGRDLLSRIIYGTRTSLMVGVVSVSMAAGVGMVIGLVAGFFKGIIDTILMRMMDAIMSIPPIVLALSLGVAMGGGLKNVMISLGIALIPSYARLIRGQVLSIREADYVIAAEISGASAARNMFVHILPNTISPLIVMATLHLGVAILAEAALSFLGLGIQPPGAAWGSMISEGYRYLAINPFLSFAPGLAVMIAVLAFSIVGDGLRDALDPKLRGTN